ncbi:hypothetical protein HYV11_02405 [Candidatus Dependentiae bacterium]|nr:hypothetical protein [Candidatus Dependentiae bacterium]
MRPHRIEPLVRLAQHYLNKQEFALSFLFAAASTKVPYPVNDLLFIEKELYDYSRYDVLGCAALHVQEFQIGKDAVIEALKVHPNYQHLLNNLNSCEAVLSKLNVFLKNEDVI